MGDVVPNRFGSPVVRYIYKSHGRYLTGFSFLGHALWSSDADKAYVSEFRTGCFDSQLPSLLQRNPCIDAIAINWVVRD